MKRILPAMCIMLLIVSCAGSPAVPDETQSAVPQEIPAESGDVQPQEESVVSEEPTTQPIAPSPEESAVDYLYPEPELTAPESVPVETKPAIAVVEPIPEPPDTVREPESGVSSSKPVTPRTATVTPVVPRPAVPPQPEPVRPTRPEARSAEPVPDQQPGAGFDEREPVQSDDNGQDPVPELWSDEPRSSEPPPPVVRPELVPSRTVTVPRDGILEVWYPGTGWVYLGDASGLVGVSYDTRKIENRDTLFTFRARRLGNYILEFSRYDVLTDEFMQDALSVAVIDPVPGKRTTVRAPDFILGGFPDHSPEPDEEPVTSMYVQDEPVLSAPIPGNKESVVQDVEKNPEEMLIDIQSMLASGDAPGALTLLDRFFEKALHDLDEGWYLRGQAYEANSAARNIRKALEAYETVVSAYPDSVRWKEADERIRYIKQFYFRVR